MSYTPSEFIMKSLDKRMHAMENRMFILIMAIITNLITTITILILK